MADRSPKDLADRMTGKRSRDRLVCQDGYIRETFTEVRDLARQTARAFLDQYPAAAYMSAVDTWRELPDGQIEFTMRRLRSAD